MTKKKAHSGGKQPREITTPDGNTYPSITAAAEAYGLSRSTLKARLKRGDDDPFGPVAKGGGCRKCKDHLGNEYKSKAAMARAYGISKDTLDRRLEAGMPLEKALQKGRIRPNATPCEDHLGNKYGSRSEMARAYGLPLSQVNRKLNDGRPAEYALKRQPGRTKAVRDEDGTEYPSISALAKAKGMSPSTLARRLRTGLDISQALSAEKYYGHSETDHLGKKYPSIKAMAEAYGLEYAVLKQRLKIGWPLEKALTTPIGNEIVDHKGNVYRSMGEMADAYGINRSILSKRLSMGMDIETALTAPIRDYSITDPLGRKFASIRELADFYQLGQHASRSLKIKDRAIDSDTFASALSHRLRNAKINDSITIRECVSWPYFEIERDGEICLAHIGLIANIMETAKEKKGKNKCRTS